VRRQHAGGDAGGSGARCSLPCSRGGRGRRCCGWSGGKAAGFRDPGQSAAPSDTENNRLRAGGRVDGEISPSAQLPPESGWRGRECQASPSTSNDGTYPKLHLDTPTPHHRTPPSASAAAMGVPFEALLPYGIMLGVRQWPRLPAARPY
jgi:hypothetical protein